jgi:capsular polysaccharide transport system permease protein
MDSSRKFKSLVVLSEPNLPDDSTVPNRLYHLLVFLLIALSVYALGRLVWNSIEEHRQ